MWKQHYGGGDNTVTLSTDLSLIHICTFHRTNTRKRRSAPKSLMDPQHLAEGSFPKDEKSVYESFLCKHVQLHCPAIHRKQIAIQMCIRDRDTIFSTYRIHFKVHQFSSCQSYDHLPLVNCTFHNLLFAWYFPVL